MEDKNKPQYDEKLLQEIAFSGFEETNNGYFKANAENGLPYTVTVGKFQVSEATAAANPSKAHLVGEMEERLIVNHIVEGMSARYLTLVIKPDVNGNTIRQGNTVQYKYFRGQKGKIVGKANMFLSGKTRLVLQVFESEKIEDSAVEET